MIRTINFAFIAITGLMCLGVYHVAEQARVAQADLRVTKTAITREQDHLTVLGAEWARVTQPARIQALAQRYLNLTDRPPVELSSLEQLPGRNGPVGPAPAFRNARAVVPVPNPAAPRTPPAGVTFATYSGT